MIVEPAYLTKISKRLVRLGILHIRSVAADKKTKYLVLTRAGQQLYLTIEPAMRLAMLPLLRTLKLRDLLGYIRTLSAILAYQKDTLA
jgi:DNA-binding MarR family transcriptional regulator